jgi:radical SAM protein with 4Fe4S-binding SPASM domain
MNEHSNYHLDKIFYNITHNCNLKCHYCYAKSDNSIYANHLSLTEIATLAKDAKECGAAQVLLSGGEPFVRSDWFEIFQIFKDLDFAISISSNGSLISPDLAERLSGNNAPVFQISFDGSDLTIDTICKHSHISEKIRTGIEILINNGFKVQLNCVLHLTNYADLPYLVQYSYEKNIPLRITLLNLNYGRGLESEPLAISLRQLTKVIRAMHVARKANPLVELNLPPLLLHPDDWFTISPSCGWAQHLCGIMCNGDVTICGLSIGAANLVAGNIREKCFQDIWHNSALFSELRSLTHKSISGVCKKCPFLEACGGSCRLNAFMESNNFCAPNHLCQSYYEAIINKTIPETDFPSGVLSLGMFNQT